jgi:hypothetical protein
MLLNTKMNTTIENQAKPDTGTLLNQTTNLPAPGSESGHVEWVIPEPATESLTRVLLETRDLLDRVAPEEGLDTYRQPTGGE